MKFIGPPATSCTQSSCSYKSSSLTIHNDPVNVTVFTHSGPIPATNVSLWCQKCMTNYNYSMFGNKQGNGEMYYEKERPLVEISDNVFIDRAMYQFFCVLRYIIGYSYMHWQWLHVCKIPNTDCLLCLIVIYLI